MGVGYYIFNWGGVLYIQWVWGITYSMGVGYYIFNGCRGIIYSMGKVVLYIQWVRVIIYSMSVRVVIYSIGNGYYIFNG